MRSLKASIATCALMLSFTDPQAATIDFDQDGGMFLARGYDNVSGAVRGDCVQRTEPQPAAQSSAQRTRFSLTKVENYNSLARLTALSASASVNGGVGHASGKASFVEEINVNDYSIYVLAQVTVLNTSYSMVDMRLNEPGTQLLVMSGPNEFRRSCGDSFVSGYTTGGELFSVIEISTKSETDKRELSLSLSGSYGTFAGSGAFREALEKISKTNAVNVHLYRVGASGAIKVTPDEMIQEATSFPDKLSGSGAFVFKATLMPYTNLPLPPGVNIIDTTNQTDVIQRVSDLRLSILQKLSNFEYITLHPDEFVNPDIPALYASAGRAAQAVNQLTTLARNCYQSVANCVFPTDLPVVEFNLPKRIESSPVAAADLQETIKKQEEARALAQQEKEAAQKREEAAREELARQQAELDRINADTQRVREEALKKQREAEAARQEAERKQGEADKLRREAAEAAANAERQRQAALAAVAEAERQRQEAEEKKKKAEKDARDAAIILGTGGVGTIPVVICRVFHC
jgi:hypothetical protein